VEIK
jgi:hypothetical protein